MHSVSFLMHVASCLVHVQHRGIQYCVSPLWLMDVVGLIFDIAELVITLPRLPASYPHDCPVSASVRLHTTSLVATFTVS